MAIEGAYLFTEENVSWGRFLGWNCVGSSLLQFLHGLVKFFVSDGLLLLFFLVIEEILQSTLVKLEWTIITLG